MTVTLQLIAVPNGFTATGALAVSVVVAPRLSDGDRLGQFPDMLDWTQALAAAPVQLALRFGARVLLATVDTAPLRPELWSALFNARTPVTPYTFDDLSDSIVVSYRTRDALDAVKQNYQSVIAASPGALPATFASARRLNPLALPEGAELAAALANHRLLRWTLRDPEARRAFSARAGDARDALLKDFALFQRMPQPNPRAPDPIPRTAAALRETIDFHAAVTALSAHPSLLRALGLVLDASVDAAAVQAAGTLGMALAPLSVERLRTERGFHDVALITPRVLYRHHPAAANQTRVFATADAEPTQIAEGYLGLDPRAFHLLDLDIDGALTKLTSLASMLPRAAQSPTSNGALPALRSAGLSLAVHDRGNEVIEGLRRAATINQALIAAAPDAGPLLTASDLVRGYRLEVWSSATQRWRSLHQRQATYSFGADGALRLKTEEEGFAQFVTASPVADPTRPPVASGPAIESDLYVHEALARWTGWSLSAPRPGKALHRSDTHDALKDDDTSDALVTAFPLRQRFEPVPGSLPALRFGARYRMRVRVVDVAGNSPPASEFEVAPVATPRHPVALPPTPEAQTYFRYEPVPHPQLVLRSRGAGGLPALDRIVIRSFNSSPALDAVVTQDADDRHVAPPRAAVELAERHGMFDDSIGKLRSDAATFAAIVARNDAVFATESLGVPPQDVPIERAASLAVRYFPDPLARTAALRFLPGVAAGRHAFAGSAGLADQPTDGTADAGPVLQVHFGDAWPDRQAFLLKIGEGDGAPLWDANTRVLTVFLPKATDREVRLSSGLASADLELLGVWAWQREYLERLSQEIVTSPGSDIVSRLEQHARLAGQLARLAREGGQWALTPSIPIQLIHAVQQPIGIAKFVAGAATSALVPLRGASLKPGRRATDRAAALTAMRATGSPDATLIGALDVHLRSTGRVDLVASWNDIADEPASPLGFVLAPAEVSIEPIRIDRMSGALAAQGAASRSVAIVAAEDRLEFRPETFDAGALVAPAAPIQHFGDTRHRRVSYRALVTSRFERDFPADQDLQFTRTSEAVVVSVPSSAPPPAPSIVQVLPTFGWQRERTGNVISAQRRGRGVRIYLERPWFASGEGELLGVVLWPGGSPPPSAATRRDELAGVVSEWGLDPVRRSGRLPAMPGLADLTDATVTATDVRIAAAGITADIAGHAVHPDGDLWFADVTLAADDAYMPFLRLALVRFQPDSIAGAEISAVASAGFIQIAPDRSAVLIADPAFPRVYRLVVSGVGPTASPVTPWRNRIEVSVEERRDDVNSDLGWQPASPGTAKVTPITTDTSAPAVLFSGVIELAVPPATGRHRLVIREFETWQVDQAPLFHPFGDVERAALAPGQRVQAIADSPALASPAIDERFVFSQRAIARLETITAGPPTGQRIVYAEFLPLEPAAGARDLSLTTGEGAVIDEGIEVEPGAELIEPDPANGVPPWPPFAGPPASGFQPRWDEQPSVRAAAAPDIVSGAVKLAQAMLNAAVSPLPPLVLDGLFGPLADIAMRAFRAATGLPDAGGIDPAGWLALAVAAPFPTLEPGLGEPPMSGPPIALVQRLLNTISDGDFLVEDGAYTSDTADRVRAFQSVSDLPPTGVVDFATWRELANLIDHFNAAGAERVTLGFDRARSEAGGPALVLLDRDRIADAVAPSSDPFDQSWDDRIGLWIELQDSQAQPVFRLRLGQPLSLPAENPGDPEIGESFARPGAAHAQTTLAFVVPVLAAARRLVVFGTIDLDDPGPASPIAVFDPW